MLYSSKAADAPSLATYMYSPSLASVEIVVVVMPSSSIRGVEALATPAEKKVEEAASAVMAVWRRMVERERERELLEY